VLVGPDGSNQAITVKGQGGQKASFKFKAVDPGTTSCKALGDPAWKTTAARPATTCLSIGVTRAKVKTQTFSVGVGGLISIPVQPLPRLERHVHREHKKGGFDLTGLVGPAGTPEPGFAAALKLKKRVSASVKKFALTGGDGAYELRGQYDAGSKVSVKLSVATNEKKTTRRLPFDEPRFDPLSPPQPPRHLRDGPARVGDEPRLHPGHRRRSNVTGHILPVFSVGGIAVDPATVVRVNPVTFTFRVPAGLAPNQYYDVKVLNATARARSSAAGSSSCRPP